MQKLSRLGGRPTVDAEKELSSAHVRIGRLKAEDRREDGIASDMAAIRQLYGNAVAAAEVAWKSAEDGMPDLPAALQTVEGLADAVAQNRTALVALTAMRNVRQLHVHAYGERVDPDDGSGARAGDRRPSAPGVRLVRAHARHRKGADAQGNPEQARQADGRRVHDHATARRRRRGDPAADARDADPRSRRRVRASPADGRHRLSLWRQTRNAQPGDDVVQHLRRVRRHALAARVSAGAPERPHPRGAAAQRRRAVRSESRPAVRAAPRHLSAGQPRAPEHGRNRSRHSRPRARSLPAARPCPLRRRRRRASRSPSIATCSSRDPRPACGTTSSRRWIRRNSRSIRSTSWKPDERSAAHGRHRIRRRWRSASRGRP